MSFATRRGLVAAALILALVGCRAQSTAPPVDPERARQALRTTLDGWKAGGTPESLRSGPAAIVAQDFDWMAGSRLVDYRIEGDGQDDDANLRIPVTLTLRDAAGKEVTKRVVYVVGTSPSVTVFRDMM
jgi:hypothetical protein